MANGNVELMNLLADELGADVEARDNQGLGPLHIAAANGNAEIMKLLVRKFGVDINEKDKDGNTPLYWTIINGHIDKANFLINELGANGLTSLRITGMSKRVD